MQKRVLFSITFILLCVAALAVFRQPITLQLAEWSVRGYCNYFLDTPIDFEELQIKEGAIVIKNPHLFFKDANASQLVASQLTIDYTLHLMERRIDAAISMKNPQLALSEISPYFEDLISRFLCSSSWMTTHFKLSIEKGTIFLLKEGIPFHFDFNAHCHESIHLTLLGWFDSEKNDTNRFEIRFNAEEKGTIVDCEIHQLQGKEAAFLLHLCFPNKREWEITEGYADGKIHLKMPEKEAAQVEGGMSFHQIAMNNTLWGVRASTDEAQMQFGNVSQHLGKLDLIKPLHLEFYPRENEGSSFVANLAGSTLLTKEMNADFSFQGLISLEGHQASIGVEGNIPFLYSKKAKGIVKLGIDGSLKELSYAMPDFLKQVVDQHFAEEHVTIHLFGHQVERGMHFDGSLDLAGLTNNQLHFGFNLDRVEKDSKAKYIVFESLRHSLGEPVLQEVISNSLVEKPLPFGEVLLKNGWFQAENLSLERFLNPFLFSGKGLAIKGNASVEGHFDAESASIGYTFQNLVAESAYFKIEAKSPDQEINQQASHYFNFATGRHFGFIPLADATYLEKNTNFVFTDAKGSLLVQENHVYIRDLETFLNGVYFAGSIDLDYKNYEKGQLMLDVRAHSMSGKVSQLQQILSSYDSQCCFLHLPLEGNAAFVKQGGFLHVDFDPRLNPFGYQVQSHVQGALTEGNMVFQEADAAIQDICCNFEYDRRANTLEFSEMQGSLLVGKPGEVEEYAIAGDRILFTDYAHSQLEFDLWVGDKKRDMVRIAGKTLPADKKNPGNIQFLFDHQLTHFGDVHPTVFELVLHNWVEVDSFQLGMNFRLNTLFRDLQRFSRTGLFFLSKNLLKELNDVKIAEGDFQVDFKYDQKNGYLVYNILGEELIVNRAKFKKFILNGKKLGEAWAIDHLQMDDLSLSADIYQRPDHWKINFLGFRYGKSLLMGIDGTFFPEKNRVDANFNLLEVNLEELHEWPAFSSIAEQLHPKGELSATGDMHVDFFKEEGWWRAEADIVAALESFELGGLKFQDTSNVKCHFASDRGIAISGVNSAFKPIEGLSQQIALDFDRIDYDFVGKEFDLVKLNFAIPADHLPWISKLLRKQYPLFLEDSLIEVLAKVKEKENLEGTLSLEISPVHHAMTMTLKEGTYYFADQEHSLGPIEIHADLHGLSLNTHYLLGQHLTWVFGKASSMELIKGHLILADQPIKNKLSEINQGLTLLWAYDPQYGYHVTKAEGHFGGLDFRLISDPNRRDPRGKILTGDIEIDMHQAGNLLSQEMMQKIQYFSLGKGYALKGSWLFDRTNEAPLSFQGALVGDHFEFAGYRLEKMGVKVDYRGSEMVLSHFHLHDPSGDLEIPEIALSQNEGVEWVFNVPQMVVKDFRPDLLQVIGAPVYQSQKPWLVQRINLKELTGDALDSTSWSGSGDLQFVTLNKKNSSNPVFVIPTEVINRLGLDAGVLSPASGTIYYQVNDGRVYFNKFKDVYSEGKLSKFFLTKNPNESYLDFEGNLHIQLKMRQYNLLFKLAELMTLTIQGTIQKPIYALQNHLSGKSDVIEE